MSEEYYADVTVEAARLEEAANTIGDEEEYASVTYYPESNVTVAIGEETPYNPTDWPQHLHADDCDCELCLEVEEEKKHGQN